MPKNLFKLIVFTTFLIISPLSNAHIGTGIVNEAGFVAGFFHPLLGLDHLLAMLAVGLWAGQNQRKILWVAPLSFMLFMIIGGILGMMNFNLPMIETEHAILVSLIVFGSLIALSIRSNIMIAILIMGVFAIFHGHTHGTEITVTTAALQYISGFVIATGMLHIIGIAIAKIFLGDTRVFISRIIGSGIIAAGVALFCIQ